MGEDRTRWQQAASLPSRSLTDLNTVLDKVAAAAPDTLGRRERFPDPMGRRTDLGAVLEVTWQDAARVG